MGGVGAMAVGSRVGERPPSLRSAVGRLTFRLERGNRFPLGQIAERQAATLATRVFEMQGLPAVLALKELHRFAYPVAAVGGDVAVPQGVTTLACEGFHELELAARFQSLAESRYFG